MKESIEKQKKSKTTGRKCELIKDLIGENKRIAVFGCGISRESDYFKKRKNYVIGIDKDKDIRRYAKRRNNKFILKDLEKDRISIKPKMDVIISFEVMEHLKNHKNFIENVKRNLKSNGILILSTPSASYWKKRLVLFWGKEKFDTHIPMFTQKLLITPKSLKEFLEKNGFTIEKMIGIGKSGFLLSTKFPFLSLCGDFITVARKVNS